MLVRPPLPQGVQGPPVHPSERRLLYRPGSQSDRLDLIPGPPPHLLHEDLDLAFFPPPDQVIVFILLSRLATLTKLKGETQTILALLEFLVPVSLS